MRIADLIAQFEQHDWAINAQAATALAQVGEEAVPALVAALANSDPYVRAGAAQALRSYPSTQAFESLLASLRNTSPGPSVGGEVDEARSSAALALGALGDQRACAEMLQVLPECLSDGASVSWYLIDALGMLRCPDAEAKLEELLCHRDVDVRKASRSALAKLRDGHRTDEHGDV